ncbi:MAG: UDP-N-acetylmuramate dehydrogenase [Clostridiales bacterium]|nr:UDP-N-acetylmuramate dehydrogenase [Clostridiales bacterium]
MDSFERLKRELNRACPGIEIKENEPMSEHTTFHIGGPVAVMALPRTTEETVNAIRVARSLDIHPFLVGRGSNLLCGDGPLEHFVILTRPGLNQLERVGETTIRCGAGVPMRQVACFAQQEGLTGFEFAHGIPGSMGGGVVMNAGAYGGELQHVVTQTTALDAEGNLHVFRGEEQRFGYRHSVFMEQELIVLETLVELQPGDPVAIQARMDDLLRRRKRTQPLEWASAGSTFKRPRGAYAAALIDQCGLKGCQVGGAQVSEKHAGFVVNRGGATCADVLALTDHVKDVVWQHTDYRLELEIQLML